MKLLVTTAIMAIISTANAAEFKCELTAYSKENYSGAGIQSIKIEGKSQIIFTAESKKGSVQVKAVLDPKFKSAKSVRYVDSSNYTESDSGETAVFVSKSLLEGKPGLVSLSTNQANDGESGSQYIWSTDSSSYCK